MTTATATTDYLAEHARLIVEREKAEGPGRRAGLSRKIALTELELDLEGIEYEPFSPTPAARETLRDLSDADVLAAHTDAVERRTVAETPGVKAGLTSRIRGIEAELEKRGVKFTRYANRGPSAQLSDEDVLTRIDKIRALLNRATCRPRIKVVAQRELESLTELAANRSLPVADSVAPPPLTPSADAGALLDQVTDRVAAHMTEADQDAAAAAALDSTPRRRVRKTAKTTTTAAA